MPHTYQLQSNIFFCGKFLESLFIPNIRLCLIQSSEQIQMSSICPCTEDLFFPCNLLTGPRPASFPKMPGSGINHWGCKRSSSCLTSLHAYLKPSQDTWVSIYFWKSYGYRDRASPFALLRFFHICYWSTISSGMVKGTLSCANECKFVLINPYPLTWSFSCLPKPNT